MHILSPVLLPLPRSLFLLHPLGLRVDSSLPLKPDNWEENEHNSNKYNLLNAFPSGHVKFFAHIILFSLYNRENALSSSLFK